MPADHSKPPSVSQRKSKVPRKDDEDKLDSTHAREIELKRSRGEISCAECRRCDHRTFSSPSFYLHTHCHPRARLSQAEGASCYMYDLRECVYTDIETPDTMRQDYSLPIMPGMPKAPAYFMGF